MNRQEVDMPSPAVQDTSVPSSSSTRPERGPAYLDFYVNYEKKYIPFLG